MTGTSPDWDLPEPKTASRVGGGGKRVCVRLMRVVFVVARVDVVVKDGKTDTSRKTKSLRASSFRLRTSASTAARKYRENTRGGRSSRFVTIRLLT
jgi:hypothetical protein